MYLQIDSSVIYALGENYKGTLNKQDLKINSPYNTYKYKGLPKGPISSVGKDSLQAAIHPKISKMLYFVSKKNGKHIFAKTYKQYIKNINKYLKNQ